MRRITLLIIVSLVSVFSVSGSDLFPALEGKRAMVASDDPIASQVGLEILKRGGNAIDAAVAIGFTMAVTYPQAGNIGGGGFMVLRTSAGKVFALDYRERAPLQGYRDMYLNKNGKVIPGLSTIGYLAAGVPGTVKGFWQAHKRFGIMNWKELIAPAIELASSGYPLDRYNAIALKASTDEFNSFPEAAKIFTKNGLPYQEGDTLVQKDLAHTLRLIADQGERVFYKGEIAEKIARGMKKNKGLITERDLREYTAVWREPIHFSYRKHDVYSMPPPSSGGILLALILNTLEQFDVHKIGWNNARSIHLWTEIERQAYADRAKWLGDPDFVEMPVRQMISDSYAATVKNKLNLLSAGNSDSVFAAPFDDLEKAQTTHFSVVDQWGNAVSNTYTLNGSFGAKFVVKETGILMNNQMDDFSVKPGVPNSYGLIGSEANAVAGGKRMLSSMSPTIITRNDSLVMVVGAAGGSRIITAVAQLISAVIDQGMNIRQAISAPRFHHQWRPDVIFLEKNRFSLDTVQRLQNIGYEIRYRESIARANAILFDFHNSKYSGWGDPRSNSTIMAY